MIDRTPVESDIDYKKIGKIIQQLRSDLCYKLKMKSIMEELLIDNLGRYYTKEDILLEQKSLNIIKNETRIPTWYYNKQLNYINERKIISINGKWSPMSKYDTNYSVHALILSDLILMAKNDSSCPFDVDFNDIYNDIIKLSPYYWGKTDDEIGYTITVLNNNLSKIKDEQNSLKDIIKYYFSNSLDFEKYSWKVLETTNQGDNVEKKFEERIVNCGFGIEGRGFNGSCVDIAFGVDFIIRRLRDNKMFTVQVKKSKPNDKELNKYFTYRYIDIIVWEEMDDIIMMNKARKTKKI